MRSSFRRKMLITKIVILIALVPLLAWVIDHWHFSASLLENEQAIRGSAFLMVLGALLIYAVVELMVWLYFVSWARRRLREFTRQVQQGSMTTSDFPELQPIIDAFRAKEQALREESAKIVWILRHVPGGLLTIDLDERITLAACPTFADLGLPVDSLVGQSLAAFHEMIGYTRANSPLLAALQQGIKSRRISRIADRYFEAVNTPMVDANGKIDGAVCLFIDVTERVRQEQELKRLERLSLVGQMSASLSHEIRNPLTVIRGFLQLHAAKNKQQDSEEPFHLLIAEIDRVTKIVQEFLTLSHSGGEWNQLSLDQIVQQMAPLLGSEATMHGVKLQLDLQPTPQLWLCSNDIKQLLLNLYRNAVEACGGQGTVQLATGVDAAGHPFLRVQDDGCGMPEQVLERLGTPFNSTKPNGTGLGLPLCLNVAKDHGAELTFTAGPEHGTIATVLFPPPLDKVAAASS